MKKLFLTIFSTLALASVGCSEDKVVTIEKEGEVVSLFDGESLDGWKAVTPNNIKYWSVIEGVITASNGDNEMPINTYLASEQEYENFEFTCDFRLSGDATTGVINSGIQYRSLIKLRKRKQKKLKEDVKVEKSQEEAVKVPIIIGYQADIGENWWGGIYDEHRRRKLVAGDAEALLSSKGFAHDNWHTYKIVCDGNHHQLFINGFLTADYVEKNPKIPAKGVIALQLHKGGVAKIEYKNIKLKKL